MADQFPEKFGKYRVIEEAGRGGFADVYKAVDTTLDRTVALKFLEPRLLREPAFVERFQREAKLAANLKHPHIVFVHEFAWEAGTVYMAMEFLEGQTLKEVLLKEGLLSPARIVNMVGQIASALDYAHGRGLVHRDIKPSNIMVGADDHVTVMDFGIAKAATQTALTTTGRIFGTPEYMSPEQAEGVEEPDARSDIYSLGVVVYEMFTGKVPFSGTTPLSILRGHADKPVPRPSEVNPDISPAVEAVLLRALAKKREERYQRAGEMVAALREAVREAPPEVVLHPSLALKLSVRPRAVKVDGEVKWTVTLRNDGDDDLRHVTVRRGRTLLDEPFELAAGKGRRFAFTTTYKTEGRRTEEVTATGIASTGESVRDEARATVRVTPVPPVVKKPVAEKVVPPLRQAADVKEKARLPTVSPAPRAVPKKALSGGTLLAGGLAFVCIVGGIIYFALIGPSPTPTPEPLALTSTPTSVAPTPVTVEDEWGVVKIARGNPIKIGFAAGLSWAGIDVLGLDEQRGAELAVKDRFEVLGFKVELQVEDSLCNAEGGRTVATKFVADPQIVAVVGHMCSSSCTPASTTYEQNGYTMVSPSCVAPSLTAPDTSTKAFNRVCWNDKIQGPAAAKFVYETLGVRKVATIHDGSPYPEQLRQEFTEGFEALGGEIVAVEAVNVGDTDMRPVLIRIKAGGPELIYWSGFVAEGGYLRSQMADVGMEDAMFMGADGIKADEFIKAAGDAAEGVYASAADFAEAGEALPKFLEAYEAEYGEAPIAPFHAHAYDAAMVILNAIEQVGRLDADGNLLIGRKALNEAIRGTKGYQGLTGTITCDEYGDCGSGSVVVFMVKDGEWVAVETLAAPLVVELEEGPPIKIGNVAPLTGDYPKMGEGAKYALEMWLEDVKSAGGLVVGNRVHDVEVIHEDNESKSEVAAAAATKLIVEDGVLAIIGAYASKQAIPTGEVADANETPMVSPWSTNPRTTEDRPYVFRTCFLDPSQGPVVANFATEEFGATKAAVLYDVASDYPKGLAEFFKDAWEEIHGEGSVVAFEIFTTKDRDFSAQLTKIKDSGAEFFFTPQYYDEVPLIVQQAHELGLDMPVVGSDSWGSAELMPLCGDDCVGLYFSTHYAAAGAKGATKEFIDRYTEKYGYVPDDVGALTWDTALIVQKAIQDCGNITGDLEADRQCVRDALAKIKDFDGITGKTTFTEEGDPIKCAVIVQINEAHEFVFYKSACP